MKAPLIRSILASLTFVGFCLPSAFAQSTTRVSVDSMGVQGNGNSYYLAISADARFVAFESEASNLVPGDTNGYKDIFVHDRQTGQTNRASVDSSGVQGNWFSEGPTISADGRYVAFISWSTNLVSNDTSPFPDVFVHDQLTGQTRLVNVNSAGVQGNRGGEPPSISSDGRLVTFSSESTNLVPGDTNGRIDIFVHDRQTGQTSRVSVDSAGGQSGGDSLDPAISGDGRLITFYSEATDLVLGDTNGYVDIFVHDNQTGQTSRVSVDSAGVQGNDASYNPSISADGRLLSFDSKATNLVPNDTNNRWDVFVHDRQTGQTSRISVTSAGMQVIGDSNYSHLTADGGIIAFQSYATNLVSGDTNAKPDVFIHDRQTGQVDRVSVDSSGGQGNFESYFPSISSDGSAVAFWSWANNLVSGDTNGRSDSFVRDRGALALNLAKTGTCPGALTLTISHATASSPVAIIYGPAGVFVKPTPPCQGLILGVSPPTLGTVLTANGSGTATLNFNAPPGVCGRSVQAVDVTACTATNVIVL